MPHIDPVAKAWELDLAKRIGDAVQARRKVLGLTAQQLAERTAELGYPITRVAISKIEGNKRAGKLDVAEWLVLAQALQIPPALLLYPGYPDDAVEGLPGVEAPSVNGVWWISGRRRATETPGTELVDLVEQRSELMWEANKLDSLLMAVMVANSDDAEERMLKQRIRSVEEQMTLLEKHIRRARAELWGSDE